MKHAIQKGVGFGLTSGVITTLGLMIGLYAGTNSLYVIMGGVISIAIADACSDSLGIHISEEVDNQKTQREVWIATIATFLTKFFFALTFLIPLSFFALKMAIIVNILWGAFLLGLFSYYIACERKTSPWHIIFEHLFIMFLVIAITYFVGITIAGMVR